MKLPMVVQEAGLFIEVDTEVRNVSPHRNLANRRSVKEGDKS